MIAGQGDGGEGRGAVVAQRRRRQGRYRRGDRPHRRRRQVPMTPFARGDAPRKPVLTLMQNRTRRAKRALAARGMVEAVTWSFIAKPSAELFGGGQPELALANPIASDLSDMRPSLLPGPDRRGAGQCRSRHLRRGAVRGRPDLQGRPSAGSDDRGLGVRRGFASSQGHRPALVRLGAGDRARRQGRCVCGARRRRLPDVGAADRHRQGAAGLAASRPLRRDPDRSAERARLFRRAASARAGSAPRRRPADRRSK